MPLSSLWQDRHDIPAMAPDAPPSAEVTGGWDVVVVGAGITGLTAAVLMAEAGLSTLVLEARLVGHGTTGRSTAKISLLQGTQFSQIAHHHSDAVVADYAVANLEAQAWLADFCASADVELDRRPAYTYGTTASGERAARRELDVARTAGLPVTWVDDVPVPFPTRGAVRMDDQMQVDPVALLLGLRARAEALGATVIEKVRVTGVHGSGPTTVSTDHGTAKAGTVVVATNTPILDRGGYFARVEAARSYSLAFRTDGPRVDGMYLSTDQPSRSLRTAVDGEGRSLLLVGGNGHPTGRTPSARARLEEIREWTRLEFGELDEIAAWSAQDYVPHHALPYAGPLLPRHEHVLFAGGFSKWGMTNGVAAAKVLTGRLTGARPGWAEAFDTWAPRELKGAATAVRANAEVGLAMTTGWVGAWPTRSASTAPREGEGVVARHGLGAPVAVSTTDGVTRRTSAVCSHLGGIVSWNDAETSWDCPLHGSRFAPDGRVLEGVATCGLARRDDTEVEETA